MLLQAWQDPLHKPSQQKLSMQRPFWQSAATAHADPTGRAVVHWCVPGLQFGAADVQSALVEQLARQAFCALQLSPNGQGPDAPAAQAPAPSHNRGAVRALPVQVCPAHATVLAANAHAAVVALTSAHCAPQTPVPLQAPRVPCGGPDATGEQVPGLMSHAWQQTLSAQKPDAHCVPTEHAEPSPRPGAPPLPGAPPSPGAPPTPILPPAPIAPAAPVTPAAPV
jgi:hypothetical protein